MTKIFSKLVHFLFVGALLSGCAVVQVPIDSTTFTPHAFSSEGYAPKVDDFLVVLDASETMEHNLGQHQKFDIAKTVVSRMNQTLPEMDLNAGLRTFGHDPKYSKTLTRMTYGMTAHKRGEFQKALDSVSRAGGTSPMPQALEAAIDDLSQSQGKVALITISDGLQMNTAPQAAKKLKAALGDRLCIYSIWVGQEVQGKEIMDQITAAGECGFTASAESLLDADAMADFVEKVFLTKLPEPPIVDAAQPTADQSARYKLDSDGDGVFDDEDKCPNTPKGARVNELGCWVLDAPLFDFDKSVVKSEYYGELNEVATIMAANPRLKIEVQGHTCNIGSDGYNMSLSLRRANAVKAYLIARGIEPSRLMVQAYGETQPAFSNADDEGRRKNRRVQFKPTWQ